MILTLGPCSAGGDWLGGAFLAALPSKRGCGESAAVVASSSHFAVSQNSLFKLHFVRHCIASIKLFCFESGQIKILFLKHKMHVIFFMEYIMGYHEVQCQDIYVGSQSQKGWGGWGSVSNIRVYYRRRCLLIPHLTNFLQIAKNYMAGANTRMQVGLGIREYSKVYIGRWNSLQLYKYEIQKHENIKVQIRVLLGETLECTGGLECVITQKCALEMSTPTLYRSFSLQQKR